MKPLLLNSKGYNIWKMNSLQCHQYDNRKWSTSLPCHQ